MKNYIRTGKGSAESAVSSATSGLNNPSAIIFFADYYIIGDVGRKLKEKYPEALVMGTIGTKLSKEIKDLVAKVDDSMQKLEDKSQKLSSSVNGTESTLIQSKKYADATTDAFEKIARSIEKVTDIKDGIEDAVTGCNKKVDAIKSEMDGHEIAYTKVMTNIDDFKSLMTQKGFIYEDISNMLKQSGPLIKRIINEL